MIHITKHLCLWPSDTMFVGTGSHLKAKRLLSDQVASSEGFRVFCKSKMVVLGQFSMKHGEFLHLHIP